MVTATVTGTSTLKSIAIKPDVVDPDDIDMLQDLVVAAVNEALKAASDKSQSQMSAITGGIGGRSGRSAVMELFAPPVERLIEEFAKLPGHRPEDRTAAGVSCARPAERGRRAVCGCHP